MKHAKHSFLIVLALAVSGCQTLPPQAKTGTGGEDRIIVQSGIDQIRDMDTGEAYYVVCDSCAKPTVKTRYRPPPAPVVANVEIPKRHEPESVVVARSTPAPIQPEIKMTTRRGLVPFAYARFNLDGAGHAALISMLSEARLAEHLHVCGYTDIIGEMSRNRRLAKARAAAIRAFLVKEGVAAERVTTSACIDCFTASNETEAGRAVNRSAVIFLQKTSEPVDPHQRDLCRVSSAVQVAMATINNQTNEKGK
jgi:outer membrane protein OmpA-like peptidoglycan-associated protein